MGDVIVQNGSFVMSKMSPRGGCGGGLLPFLDRFLEISMLDDCRILLQLSGSLAFFEKHLQFFAHRYTHVFNTRAVEDRICFLSETIKTAKVEEFTMAKRLQFRPGPKLRKHKSINLQKPLAITNGYTLMLKKPKQALLVDPLRMGF